MSDYYQESLKLHEDLKGKIGIKPKLEVKTSDDLSRVYSPGVAAPCELIVQDPSKVYDLTIKSNSVAVVSDGSAVLGLGDIGPLAAIPVMEGKAMLFKQFADIDAFPICLNTKDPDEIVETVKRISPVFGGINLEDISAPRSFEIEARLQDIGIPVFHDDQHGTAIVVLAGLINACKVVGKDLGDLKIVINGAGAAGIAIARLLRCISIDPKVCIPVKEVIVCDSRGIIHRKREHLNDSKLELLSYSNPTNQKGFLTDALVGADVFIGVSVGNVLKKEDIGLMSSNPIIFALANPTPEIMPKIALKGGARIVATGRSDFFNQVNNVLAFPGIFRGALDACVQKITPAMKMSAAHAIANCVEKLSEEKIIPSSLNREIAYEVAKKVKETAISELNI